MLDRSFAFGIEIMKFCKKLRVIREEPIVIHQLLKAGTSVGANIREAQGAETRRDFAHKMQIALKELKEAKYWLELLRASVLPSDSELFTLLHNAENLANILAKIVITTKSTMSR